ncbi:MAG TPA: pitrilysin family protein [Myxococcaceae bacterium]|jgi:zinc protease
MPRHLRVTLAAALSFAMAASAPAAEKAEQKKPFFPYPMKVETLPNGLTVVRVPFASNGMIAYYSAVRTGSRNEVEQGHTGFAHFFEHMMFKGTKKHPTGEREKILGELGFDDNAYTSDDCTVYHSFGPAGGLEKLIEVEADRFSGLDYGEPTFQTEAKAILGEYHKNAARPELKMEEALNAAAFKKHTYSHTTLGFYDDIKAMPGKYEYSKSFFQRWYRPDNVIVYIVGEFDDAKTMALVKAAYGPWQGKAAQVEIPKEPAQAASLKVGLDWDTPTLSRHVHAWRTPAASLTTLDGQVQTVLASYLVGPTSPVYKELVLEKQLAEQVGPLYNDHRDPYLFAIAAQLKDEQHRAAVEAAFDREVKALASGKVDAKRVTDIRANLRYSFLMGLETADDIGNVLAFYGAVLGTPDALDGYYRRMDEVQPSHLVQFAKKYLTDQNRTVLTLKSKAAAAQPEGK